MYQMSIYVVEYRHISLAIQVIYSLVFYCLLNIYQILVHNSG